MSHSPFSTCDFCDQHKADTSGQFRVLPPVFASYGARPAFAGPVSTVKCFEDNTLVKAAVDSPGQGRVLVVDGGGSLRRALVGGNLAAAAARTDMSGMQVGVVADGQRRGLQGGCQALLQQVDGFAAHAGRAFLKGLTVTFS